MDRLPDELIRHISDYGGIYTAKNIADTSRSLANVYNIPSLVEGVRSHRASMEECKMYQDTLREVSHAMEIMYYIMTDHPNISPEEGEDMLLNYDPMWFTLSERMQEKAEEYLDSLPYSYWSYLGHYGPDTHEYTRAKTCSDLLYFTGMFIARFNSWVKANLHSRDIEEFRTYQMRILQSSIPEIQTLYNTAESLLARCIEARPESTYRDIYSFRVRSRRPRKPIRRKGRKARKSKKSKTGRKRKYIRNYR